MSLRPRPSQRTSPRLSRRVGPTGTSQPDDLRLDDPLGLSDDEGAGFGKGNDRFPGRDTEAWRVVQATIVLQPTPVTTNDERCSRQQTRSLTADLASYTMRAVARAIAGEAPAQVSRVGREEFAALTARQMQIPSTCDELARFVRTHLAQNVARRFDTVLKGQVKGAASETAKED